MKILLFFLLSLTCMVRVYSQSTLPLRADTVVIEKVGGNANFKLKDATRDSLGIMYNIGGGVTRFKRVRLINDTSFVVGNDTIRIHGADMPSVPIITASNGLTKTGDDIQFGSASYPGAPLVSQRYIDADIYGILINRSNASGSTIPLQVYDDGGAGQAPFAVSSVNNPAMNASSTNGTAVGINSTNGIGAQISSINNTAALFINTPATTNTVEDIIVLQGNSQGTVANGFGRALDFQLQAAGGFTSFSNSIVSKWTNATNRTSILEFYGSNSGTQSRKAALAGNGQWTWPEYPGLTHQTDTITYKPIAYDGSGNIVPMAGWIGSGGGGATLNNIGTGFAWAATPGGNIKRVANSNTILWDSTSTANSLTAKADTSVLATQYDLTQQANFTAGNTSPSASFGSNGNYYLNQLKSQLFKKNAGAWDSIGYIFNDTIVPLRTDGLIGPIVNTLNAWDTAGFKFNTIGIARNANHPGNALIAYKDDPVAIKGWNVDYAGGILQSWKPQFFESWESNFDTRQFGRPGFEFHWINHFSPGGNAYSYSTGERIMSGYVAHADYDAYIYWTLPEMWWQWREAPGAGLTRFMTATPGGLKILRTFKLDSVYTGSDWLYLDNVPYGNRENSLGLARMFFKRTGFLDTCTLRIGTGGDFVFQTNLGSGRTMFNLPVGVGLASDDANGHAPVQLNQTGDIFSHKYDDATHNFDVSNHNSIYGLSINKTSNKQAYLNITNGDARLNFNTYWISDINVIDSAANGINFNFERRYNGSSTSSSLISGYGWQFNLNDVSRLATVFTDSTASNGNRLANFVWSTKSTGATSLTEKMRLIHDGNLLIGTATDNGVGKLQINGKITVATVDSASSPANMLWIDPITKVIKKAAVPVGITSVNSQTGPDINISGDATNGISVSATSNTVTITSTTDLESFGTDANNTGTSETDLFSHTLAANKLTLGGKAVRFRITGSNNDATATEQIKGYFAGTNIFDSGALTISAAGDWVIDMEVQRTTSTTAAATVTFTADNTTVSLPVKYTALTGLDWTTTNIFKVTGTAAGATGGSNDITAHVGKVVFVP